MQQNAHNLCNRAMKCKALAEDLAESLTAGFRLCAQHGKYRTFGFYDKMEASVLFPFILLPLSWAFQRQCDNGTSIYQASFYQTFACNVWHVEKAKEVFFNFDFFWKSAYSSQQPTVSILVAAVWSTESTILEYYLFAKILPFIALRIRLTLFGKNRPCIKLIERDHPLLIWS